jgi:hypothetical protein
MDFGTIKETICSGPQYLCVSIAEAVTGSPPAIGVSSTVSLRALSVADKPLARSTITDTPACPEEVMEDRVSAFDSAQTLPAPENGRMRTAHKIRNSFLNRLSITT